MKLLGANWKTTVSGIGAALFATLTILATLPFEMGDVANIFPLAWKAKIAVVAAISALILKVWNSIQQKSREVTGGPVQQTLQGNFAKVGTQTLVDATVRDTIKSGETVTPEQKRAVG
jgi:hypothetical protein